jgi:hypothetical protein
MRFASSFASIFFAGHALFAVDVHAQVMVCVNSDGRKEYAATCPPGTVSQKELRPKGTDPQGAGNETPSSSWQDQERAFQERRIQRETAEAAEAKKQQQQQNAERFCANARRKMEQLQSGRRLRWVDRTTGERPVMTEEEHAAEMKAVEAELRRCRS